jgi:probable phosphomutase (TIGR03848 family)
MAMSQIVLLRHAHSSANKKGILSGRSEGVALSEKGTTQAQELIDRLNHVSFSAIRVSPMQRCAETINPWLSLQKKSITEVTLIESGITEVDFGSWTGKKLSQLSLKKEWKVVQQKPEDMVFPNGESLQQLQRRALDAVSALASMRGTGPKLMVTHADVIKAILSGLLSSGLRDFQKFSVDPASFSIIDFNKKTSRIISVNNSHSNLRDLLAN